MYIKEYVDVNERNYSYHWQDKNQKLILRWDNSPHHKDVLTFPHHKHQNEEVAHIHIETPDGECKFWLEPICIARNKGVPPHVIRDLEKLVFEHCILLKEKYNEFHSH